VKVLVWQWGRFGAGPRLGVEYADALGSVASVQPMLSLSDQAEIVSGPGAVRCDLPVRTYSDLPAYIGRLLSLPRFVPWLTQQVAALAPDIALCAMPGPLDLAMHSALRRVGVPYAVVVHDADPHPGDRYKLQLTLQRRLVRRADALVILSDHVERRLSAQGLLRASRLIRSTLPQPPILDLPPVRAHGGPFRLLSFGRLLAYKGLDILAGALAQVLPDTPMVVRVVGQGPEGPELAALRRIPGVTVENRWVPETEIPDLLAWADGLVLSHREASQSGVAAAALAARRYLVATRVGGLAEQAAGDASAVLCDVDPDSLAQALRHMLTLPVPAPRAGFGQPEAEALATALQQIKPRQTVQ
jgi:glycosyltransferase involved in cell wall biosynthesis